jgi:hypothetical protein
VGHEVSSAEPPRAVSSSLFSLARLCTRACSPAHGPRSVERTPAEPKRHLLAKSVCLSPSSPQALRRLLALFLRLAAQGRVDEEAAARGDQPARCRLYVMHAALRLLGLNLRQAAALGEPAPSELAAVHAEAFHALMALARGTDAQAAAGAAAPMGSSALCAIIASQLLSSCFDLFVPMARRWTVLSRALEAAAGASPVDAVAVSDAELLLQLAASHEPSRLLARLAASATAEASEAQQGVEALLDAAAGESRVAQAAAALLMAGLSALLAEEGTELAGAGRRSSAGASAMALALRVAERARAALAALPAASGAAVAAPPLFKVLAAALPALQQHTRGAAEAERLLSAVAPLVGLLEPHARRGGGDGGGEATLSSLVIESPHPYADASCKSFAVEFPAECAFLVIELDARSALQADQDQLLLLRSPDDETPLATLRGGGGQRTWTLPTVVPGNSALLRFSTASSAKPPVPDEAYLVSFARACVASPLGGATRAHTHSHARARSLVLLAARSLGLPSHRVRHAARAGGERRVGAAGRIAAARRGCGVRVAADAAERGGAARHCHARGAAGAEATRAKLFGLGARDMRNRAGRGGRRQGQRVPARPAGRAAHGGERCCCCRGSAARCGRRRGRHCRRAAAGVATRALVSARSRQVRGGRRGPQRGARGAARVADAAYAR